MSKHLGNLTVTKDNLHSFPAVDEIYGHLTIAAGAELRAPRLALVRGWVTLVSGVFGEPGEHGGRLFAPQLGLIDGWLTMGYDSGLHAIHLAEIRQDFTVGEKPMIELPALATVSSISVDMNAYLGLTSLTEIRENVSLRSNAALLAPVLTRIGRSITLREGSRLDAPALNFIGGYADIDENARLSAPRFIS